MGKRRSANNLINKLCLPEAEINKFIYKLIYSDKQRNTLVNTRRDTQADSHTQQNTQTSKVFEDSLQP